MVVWASCNWCCLSTWCLTQVEMSLLLLLLWFPFSFLILPPTQVAQELEFVVLNTSVHREQKKTNPYARNPYSLVGHNMRMLCTYTVNIGGDDYCAQKENTNLTVQPSQSMTPASKRLFENRHVVISQTKCNLTVEFQNMTEEMEGMYKCRDLTTSESAPRRVKVGKPPVKPRNISIVYSPNHSIALNLDPVKTGRDLNSEGTTWTVQYKWRRKGEYQVCRSHSVNKKKCKKLSASGLCQPCVIKLKKSYAGCGQYTDFGFIAEDIHFRISVTNIYGKVTINKKFDVRNWVQPDAVQQLDVTSSPSSLAVTVHPSKDLMQAGMELNTNDSRHRLKLQWSVHLIQERDQNLLHKEDREFFERYGFVRNLEDDMAALNKTAFTKSSGLLLWKSMSNKSDCGWTPSTEQLLIPDLQYSGYCYNVSVQTFARYPGEKVFLNASLACTEETAPIEEPALLGTFCDNSIIADEACVSCIVYFKEIPRSKRGGVVEKYTITVTPLNIDSLLAKGKRCRNTTGKFVMEIKGQDNAVVIHDLAVGDYNISLQAHTAAGDSPVSSKTMRVYTTPPSAAPQNIVLEKRYSPSLWMYDLIWSTAQPGQHDRPQYFVHYCNATAVQLQRNTYATHNQTEKAAEKPLKCVANMVTKPVNDTSTFTFSQPPQTNGLTTVFFVSSVTPDGVNSELQSVGSFYTANTLPEKVKTLSAQPDLDNPHALTVTFSLPHGTDLSYQYGRPEYYAIGMQKMTQGGACRENCGQLMRRTDFHPVTLSPHDNLQKQVIYKPSDLEADTEYCIGVNIAGRSSEFLLNRWHCVTAKTVDSGLPLVIGSIFGSIFFIGILAFLIYYCICQRLQKYNARFHRGKKEGSSYIVTVPQRPYLKDHDWMQDLPLPNGESWKAVKAGLQGAENRVYSNDICVFVTSTALSSVSQDNQHHRTDRVGNVDPSHSNSSEGSAEKAMEGNGLCCPRGTNASRYPSLVQNNGTADEDDSYRSSSSVAEADDEEDSGDEADDSSCCRKPLINAHTEPAVPASRDEERAFISQTYSEEESESELVTFVDDHVGMDEDEESNGEAVFRRVNQPGQGAVGALNSTPLISDILSAAHDSSGLTSLNPVLPKKSVLHTADKRSTLSPAELSLADECLMESKDVLPSSVCTDAAGDGMGQTMQQGAKDSGQYSIDDILHAAPESSPDMLTPDLPDTNNNPEMQGTAMLPNHLNSSTHRRSARATDFESGIETESS